MKSRHLDVKWILIALIVAFLLVFQVLPLLYLITRTFIVDGHFSLETIKRIYSYEPNLTCIKNTLVSSFLSMIFGVLIAFPLAWLVGRTNLYGKTFFRSVFVMTYMVPPYVGAMAWLRLLNPTVGTMNVFLKDLFGLQSMPFNIYSMGGLVWVLTTFYYPYAFITISRAMENMDPSLEESARSCGASPLKTLLTVTLPLTLPAIVAGGLLVFIAASSCYGIPSIIGAPGKIYTITTRIVDYVSSGSKGSIPDAATLAVFLMIVSFLILRIFIYPLKNRDFITVSGKSTQPVKVDLGKWRIPATILVALFVFTVVILPFFTVFATSFTVNMGKSVFAPGNFTFKYWMTIVSRASIIKSVTNSVISAVCAATLGMIVCVVMAYLLKRTSAKGKEIPDFLITVGSGTPSVVIALSLIMTMSGKFGINIYNTIFIMITAYMIKYMLMGMRTCVAAFSQISVSLEEAAEASGAGFIRRMKDITIPLILPSIVAGWFLIFMPSFYELTMSNLLYSSNTKTLGVDLFLYQTYHSQQTASALAGGILIMVLILNTLINKTSKGRFSI